MSYCIIRAAKLGNTGKIRATLEHNTRTRPCEKADPTRTPLNEILVGTDRADDALDEHARILAGLVKQKNSVQAIEYVVACPPEAIEALDGPRSKPDGKYLREALAWLAKRHGGAHRVIHAAIHRDEESPHIHVIVVPVAKLTRRGGHTHDTLSASQYVGGKKRLAALQTEFAEGVGKLFGLLRGIPKEITRRLHRPVRDWDAARVAAIKSQDLDGLSPEDLKAIILRQREALRPTVQTGGIQPTSTPPPSPTFPPIPDGTPWPEAYKIMLERAAMGDAKGVAGFKLKAEKAIESAVQLYLESPGGKTRVTDGMIGNRPALGVVKREQSEQLARLLSGSSDMKGAYARLDKTLKEGQPTIEPGPVIDWDKGR